MLKKKKKAWETFVCDEHVYYLDCSDGFIYVYILGNIKLYTFNVFSLLYVNLHLNKAVYKIFKQKSGDPPKGIKILLCFH